MLRFLNGWLIYPLAERAAGRKIRAKTRALLREIATPFPQRKRQAQARLADQLERAASDVPYYRDLFARLRFQPGKLARDLDYLQELPYLTKEIVRSEGPRMLSRRFDPGELHVRQTGGSTGPSVLVSYSQDDLDWTAAANQASLARIGKRPNYIELHLSSRFPEIFPWRDRLKEQLKCWALNRVNVCTDSFEPARLHDTWRQIRRARPQVLQGHPSTLYALAVYLRGAGIDARGVVGTFTSTGEVLDAAKRSVIEHVFGCRVIDRYGNAEFGVLAHESGDNSDHRQQVFDWIAWPETREHADGRTELVFTALHNEAMPLVRYCTGDVGELSEVTEGYFVRNIAGRVHDLISIAGKPYPTHYLQDLLDRIGGIDEFQVVQRAEVPVLRLVVPEIGRQDAIVRRIHAWWGDGVAVEFTDFDGLIRTGWRGKFRHLVDARLSA